MSPATRHRRVLQAGIVAAWLGWLSLVILAPWARSQEWWWSSLLYAFFHQVCHQIPERSFHLFQHPLAVCHRCTGLYLGFGLGLLLLPPWSRLPGLVGLRDRLVLTPRLAVLFILPMLADVLWRGNTDATRFVTGLVAAFPIGLLACLAIDQGHLIQLKSTGEEP